MWSASRTFVSSLKILKQHSRDLVPPKPGGKPAPFIFILGGFISLQSCTLDPFFLSFHLFSSECTTFMETKMDIWWFVVVTFCIKILWHHAVDLNSRVPLLFLSISQRRPALLLSSLYVNLFAVMWPRGAGGIVHVHSSSKNGGLLSTHGTLYTVHTSLHSVCSQYEDRAQANARS